MSTHSTVDNLETACQIVNRHQNGGQEYADADAEENNHNRLDEANDRVNSSNNFALIESSHGFQDISEFAGLRRL